MRHRTARRVLAGCTVVAAAAVGAYLVGVDGGSADTTLATAAAVENAQPVVVPVAAAQDSFEVEFREAELGMEITDSDGAVVQAATLETHRYRLVHRSPDDWELTNVDTASRTVYADGIVQEWADGQIVSQAEMADATPPARLAMPLAVQDFHAHMEERGFARTARSSQNGTVREGYERRVPRPNGEHYQSLDWRDDGNVEQVSISYEETSRRIVKYVHTLNGQTIYDFELLAAH